MSFSLPLPLQYAVIAAAVAVSAWVVLRKQAPNVERRLRIALAVPLVREGRPAWMRSLGRKLAPMPKTASDCGGCDGCGPDQSP